MQAERQQEEIRQAQEAKRKEIERKKKEVEQERLDELRQREEEKRRERERVSQRSLRSCARYSCTLQLLGRRVLWFSAMQCYRVFNYM